MPYELSGRNGITDGIANAAQWTVHTGAGASLTAVHDGLTAYLTSAVMAGSVAPMAAAAILLAAGGLHVLTSRPIQTLRPLPIRRSPPVRLPLIRDRPEKGLRRPNCTLGIRSAKMVGVALAASAAARFRGIEMIGPWPRVWTFRGARGRMTR